MPNRYVREGAIDSPRVNRLTWKGEVFYRRLLNRVDDFGRFHANPELLLAYVFPVRSRQVSVADIGKMLDECQKCDLLTVYEVDGKEYLEMHVWERGRARTSKFPANSPTCDHTQTSSDTRWKMSARAPDPDYDSDHDNDPDPDSDKGWFSNPDFSAAWKAWAKSRKKKPTDRQLTALEKLAVGSVETATAILNQSADNGWTGLFPLKGVKHGTHRPSRADRLDADAADLKRILESAGS